MKTQKCKQSKCPSTDQWINKMEYIHTTEYYSTIKIKVLIQAWVNFENINIMLTTILKEMGIPDHLTCLLRNLYAGQEATVRTGHGTTDWFLIRKEVRQGCILSPCLFNLYTEHIMRNSGLEEAQAGIKIARRNINNLRYADDSPPLWQKVKRSSKAS